MEGLSLLGGAIFLVGAVLTIVGGLSLVEDLRNGDPIHKAAWLLVPGVIALGILFGFLSHFTS